MAYLNLGGQSIKAQVQERRIPHLVHFTQAANLPSILRHGIVPIADAQARGLPVQVNDALRLDNCKDASSVSIGFPNASMFYKYRCENPWQEWVVLLLDPAVLWLKPALFCSQNAASNAMRLQSREQRASVEAFQAMYSDVVGQLQRQQQVLMPYDPTDVQAEVLIGDVIEPVFIRKAVFNNPATRERYWPTNSAVHCQLVQPNGSVFAGREYSRSFL